jgi:N-ethylmaleimide reductase
MSLNSKTFIALCNKRTFSTSSVQPLLTPGKVGDLTLKNRLVMASLTRTRCARFGPDMGIPNDLLVEYYSKRAADAGLVFTECSAVAPEGNSFPGSASIYTEKQVEGWKRITDAVHKNGGHIFAQLWHAGRAAHPDQIGGQQAISSSDIPIKGMIFTG